MKRKKRTVARCSYRSQALDSEIQRLGRVGYNHVLTSFQGVTRADLGPPRIEDSGHELYTQSQERSLFEPERLWPRSEDAGGENAKEEGT